MSNPTAAMLVIGDEILSGRTRDANFHHLAEQLTDRGIQLQEARIVADRHEQIVAAVNGLRCRYDHVFTSGGIGPTHDDITAAAVADAFGVKIDVREDARSLIAERCAAYGLELNEARLRMARIPDGAVLVHNQVSAAPGFTIGNVHVLAGVPDIFRSMLAGLLVTIPGGSPLTKRSLEVSCPEGELASALGGIADRYPDLQIGSYPYQRGSRFGVSIVVRGEDEHRVILATAEAREKFAGRLAD